MGLLGSSNLSADILLMLIINIALSIGQIKHAFHSFMHVIGLLSDGPTAHDATHFAEEYSLSSSLMLPGLSAEIRQALPLVVYKPVVDVGVESKEGVECSVCLHEFHENQEVRCLPACSHVFHRVCLDRWLEHEQFTCPLCRSSLVPEQIWKKQRKREEEISEELFVWFSTMRGLGSQGLQYYS